MLGVGIIGAGAVGARRAAVAASCRQTRVVAVYDIDPARAERVARQSGALAAASAEDVLDRPGLDLVVVATTHDALAGNSLAALRAGKHVLCEKPMARTPGEARAVVEAAAAAGRRLGVGYNHRYHPAVQKVQQACASGQLGPLLCLRGRYGHGGRPGYEGEWRALPERSGGGELLDQGAHLFDLARWLLGPFAEVSAHVATLCWEMAVEDNAFVLLRAAAGQVASLHVSWTQWKNLFSLEVFGRDGYAVAEGLGGWYGLERATVGRRAPAGGPPHEESVAFPGADRSWELEWEEFVAAVQADRPPLVDGQQALETLEWIHRAYAASSARRTVAADEKPWR